MARAHLPLILAAASACWSADAGATESVLRDKLFPDLVSLPEPGARDLRVLSRDLLEARVVQGRREPGATIGPSETAAPELGPEDFEVTADGKPVAVKEVGLRRLPIYADYHEFDLRLLLHVFLRLGEPLRPGSKVEVRDRDGRLWSSPMEAVAGENRASPAIHFSRHGFAPGAPKYAFVSYDLGTMGEMGLPEEPVARLLDAGGKEVFRGPLASTPDAGWKWSQKVWRFDFSAFRQPGTYCIDVPGLGRAGPVLIDEAALSVSPRLLALGLYNQRSGSDKAAPYTGFGHRASHTAPAEIPDGSWKYKAANRHVGAMAGKNSEGQTAPVMESFEASLYPIVRRGSTDVSGGHYDAGDYSKYVLNSAQLIHNLVFAVDHFDGVGRIDNLGLPESGDGIADALQIAMREGRFLLKMQDDDGGFFFLVYPRDRSYELDVLPENGDPQVVFPKNTAATAACVGALAQLAASPALKKADPALAGQCLAAAERGYAFLRRAIGKHGFDGSYQAISHYGNFDGHRDELCYAAAAMFVATGNPDYQRDLMSWWPDPLDGRDKKWGWVPLYEAYGAAARTYAFAEAPGLLPAGTCDASYGQKMRRALLGAAETWMKLADADAYGLPFSLSSKRQMRAGWFWAMDPAVDLAAVYLLEDDASLRERILSALALWSGYEGGGNPVDRSFFTGDGPVWRRQAVNRISLNDNRRLAVPGIPIGNVVSTPHNLKPYQIAGASGLRKTFIPALDEFPFYDRSATDAYNVREEWNVGTGARLLAGHLFLMGRSPEAGKAWVPCAPAIDGIPDKPKMGDGLRATLALPEGLSAEAATIVWELEGHEPIEGTVFSQTADRVGSARLTAEILWPDGRRLAAERRFEITD